MFLTFFLGSLDRHKKKSGELDALRYCCKELGHPRDRASTLLGLAPPDDFAHKNEVNRFGCDLWGRLFELPMSHVATFEDVFLSSRCQKVSCFFVKKCTSSMLWSTVAMSSSGSEATVRRVSIVFLTVLYKWHSESLVFSRWCELQGGSI